MYTIKEEIRKELIIKNSKFISIIQKVNNLEDIHILLKEIKKEYPKATHYCYAYILDDRKKASDDKEPTNTAGLPILNVLEKQELNHVLAIVVRYFGGIKLGAGGLIRAYSKSVQNALELITKIELNKGKLIKLEISYSLQKQLDYLLRDSEVVKKEYKERIIYYVLIEQEKIASLTNFNYEVIEDTYIEKK